MSRFIAFLVRRSMVVGVLIVLTTGAHAVGDDSAEGALAKLFDESWEFDLEQNPLMATDVGDHRRDDKLPNASLEAMAKRNEAYRKFVERLEAIDRNALGPQSRINYDIYGRLMRERLREYEFQTHLMPIADRYGFHIEFPDLPRNLSFDSQRDYENYIARLEAFLPFVAQHIELMRAGMAKGLTVPAVIMQRYREPLEAQIVSDPEKSLLYDPLRRLPGSLAEAEQDALRAAARKAIATSVVPGYERFLTFMEKEYVPHCRGTIAASALPGGREYYRYCVGKYTTLDDLTPEEIHAIGLAEVNRLRGEMEEVIRRIGFNGDFAAFTKFLRTDPQFYARTAEELERDVAFILKRMDGQLPTLFGHLPRTPYGVREVPAFIAPQATFAYYQPPAGDGSRAGFFFLNTFNLPARPKYMLEALALHEAVPGHHLQIALQQELQHLPNFRKFGGFTVFVEGWALYSERLGLETGFYQDPYSDFGRLTMEVWRACRLVVDTGMHYLGWTREQAIEYMLSNSAMAEHDIRAEVDRYIGWPGQALAYKIGELRIRELRAKAEQQLGDDFDVRSFHDVVLGNGAVPLDVLEANVAAWVEDRRTGGTDGPTAGGRTAASEEDPREDHEARKGGDRQ